MPQLVTSASYFPEQRQVSQRAAQQLRIRGLIPLLFVFYTLLLLPPEAQITVAGLNLPFYRLALLLVFIPTVRMIAGSRVRPIPFLDLAVGIVGIWIMFSFMVNYGFEVGIVRGAATTIDTVVPYMAARACIRSLDDLRYFLILSLPGLAVAGSMLVLESLSGRLIVRPFFASLFGNLDAFAGGESTGTLQLGAEFRLGLLRAYGPFPHPILAGAVMIGFLPLYYFSGLRSWPFLAGILVCLTGFFGLSSAAFLALILSVALILVSHAKAFIPKLSWWTISGTALLFLWALHVASKNGIVGVITRLTLTPTTADYRRLIWEIGSVSVAKNPWFGIGYRSWERLWWMGESVDAHFLLLAMRHGLIVPVVLILGIIAGMIRLGMVIPYLSPADRTFAIGINICVINFVIVGQTVNFFGSSNLVLMMVIAFLASAVSWGIEQARARQHEARVKGTHMLRHQAAITPGS